MSIVNERGEKIVLSRGGPNAFWKMITDHYINQKDQRWKYLAMLALRENSHWPIEQIALAFGHSKGYVSRCLKTIKQELFDRFQVPLDEWQTDCRKSSPNKSRQQNNPNRNSTESDLNKQDNWNGQLK